MNVLIPVYLLPGRAVSRVWSQKRCALSRYGNEREDGASRRKSKVSSGDEFGTTGGGSFFTQLAMRIELENYLSPNGRTTKSYFCIHSKTAPYQCDLSFERPEPVDLLGPKSLGCFNSAAM